MPVKPPIQLTSSGSPGGSLFPSIILDLFPGLACEFEEGMSDFHSSHPPFLPQAPVVPQANLSPREGNSNCLKKKFRQAFLSPAFSTLPLIAKDLPNHFIEIHLVLSGLNIEMHLT